MRELEDRMHGGSNARRVGCPEVMKSRSLCLSYVSVGVGKGGGRHTWKRMDVWWSTEG